MKYPALTPVRMGLFLALFAAPTVFLPGNFFPYSYPKMALLAGGAFLLWLGAWAGEEGERLLPSRTPLDLPLAVLTAVWIAAAVGGLEPAYAWLGQPETLTGVLTFLVGILLYYGGTALPNADRRLPAQLAAGAGAALALHAMLQAAGLDPLPQPAGGLPLGRVIAGAGQPVLLAALLAMAVPAAWSVRKESVGRRRAAWTAVLAAICSALILSRARGSLLAAAAGFAAAWLCASETVSPKRRAWLLVILIAACLGVGAAATLRPRGSSDAGRMAVWRLALKSFAHRPLLGAGPDGVHAAALEVLDDAAIAAFGVHQTPRSAHDDLLQAAVTTGLFGLTAYLTLLIVLVRALAKTGDPAAAGAVTALLIHAKFNPAPPTAWAAAAILVGAALGRSQDPSPRRFMASAGVALAAVFFAVAAWGWRADRMHQTAARTGAAHAAAALPLFEQAVRAAPWDGRSRESYAAFLVGIVPRAAGEPQRAALIDRIASLGRETTRWHPSDSVGHQMLALSCFLRARAGDRGALDEAWTALEAGRRLNRYHVPLLELGAAVARERGDLSAATQWAGEGARLKALSGLPATRGR